MVEAAIRNWRRVTDYLAGLVDALEGDDWDARSACGSWSNRELFAHLATGYVVRIATLLAFLERRPLGPSIDVQTANEANVARLAGEPPPEILREMLRVRGEVEELLRRCAARRPEEQIETEGGAETLGSYLARINDHDLEHAAQLRPRRGTMPPPPDLEPPSS